MGLKVKTYVGPSQIAGIGVFAGEDIAEGTLTWAWDPAIDRVYSRAEVAAMAEPLKSFLDKYAYWDDTVGGFALCGDNARFMNHADEPCVRGSFEGYPVGGCDFAARLIRKGEELTCDYRTFDGETAAKLTRVWE